jgi:MFS family permease
VTLLMLVLSARSGDLAQRIGPRIPMTLGPLVCAAGLLLMLRIGPEASYLLDVLPGVIVLGLGLSLAVAPLTATVLAAVDDRHAGLASGVNNSVARVAGLLAVAVLPLVVGLGGDQYADPAALNAAFHMAMLVSAGLLIVGGVLAFFTIRSTVLSENSPREPGEGPCTDPGSRPREKSPCRSFSPVGGPPLHPKLANHNA